MLGIPIGTLDQLMWAFCGVLGAIVGSFLNVCIYRIPIEGLQVSSPRGSFCPSCKSAVRWFDNIPVFAWLWLRGRCRDCSNPISPRYPLVEALTAALFLLAACRFGGDVFASEQLSTGVFDLSAMLFLVAMWTWISVLIVVSGIDFDHKIIPDRLSIPATCLVLLLSPWNSSLSVAVTATETSFLETVGGIWALAMSVLAGTVIVGGGFQRWIPNWEGQRRDSGESSLAYCIGALVGVLAAGYMVDSSSLVPESLSLTRIWTALMGAGVGAGLIYGIGKIGSIIFRKPAMGFGDVKWMGLLGATLGPLPTLFAFLLACLLGSVVGVWIRIRRGSSYIPFGPFLSAGALSMLLARPELQMLWDSYLSLLQG